MRKEEAKERIEKLKKTIDHHRYLYHVLDKQEISDAALDSLKKELFDLEQEFPDLITLDSPTQRVGGEPLEKFKKVEHRFPMLSFNDAFSKEDIIDWEKRIKRLLKEDEINKLDYYCELKIDGLAIEMIYENGFLIAGSTRGNGTIGEDITQNLKTIEAIPLKIEEKKDLIIRGEAFISKKDFNKVNKEREKQGLEPYSNPRNLAAGSIRQLDPKITALRKLDSFAYDILTGFEPKTHEEKHRILKDLGFKTNKHNRYCKNLEEVFKFYQDCGKIREKLDYEIDGLVVIVNNNELFKKLGVVGKAPRGAIAFKFPAKQATTIVEDIKVQVGRTGALTPVAILKPVEVSGVIVSRATLHNEDEIKRLGIKIGDTVIVERAGDVIPDIVGVLTDLRTGKEKEFKMPSTCPNCKSKVERKPGEVNYYCTNPKCFARERESFYHFVSAFDIMGLGPKIIDRLIEEGLVSDPADLFDLKEGDLSPLQRFAEKSASNLIASISKSKIITLPKLIYALGIRNVGEKTAIDLAKSFKNIKEISKASIEDLENIADIGPVVAESIYNWFNVKKNSEFLDKLLDVGVEIKNPKSVKNGKLEGLKFVITGTLESMPRERAKEEIMGLGGEIVNSVSKNTDYLVAGEAPGTKLEKAKELGVKILNEKEFLKLIS